jgi:hypothetical protein
MGMNLLATVDQVKRALEVAGTTYDALITEALRATSRLIEGASGWSFVPTLVTRYVDGNGKAALWLPTPWLDITTLSLSSDQGSTYTALGATDWWESDGVNYEVTPIQLLVLNPNGSYGEFYAGLKAVKIEGVLGWHRDYAAAWEASGDTVQDASGLTASATSITVTDADGADAAGLTPRFSVGNLLKVESELLEVTAVVASTTNKLTVVRGVNGSTGATHAKGTAISVWRPDDLAHQAALIQAIRFFKRAQQAFADAGANVDLGQLVFAKKLDPDVEAILLTAGLRRVTVG